MSTRTLKTRFCPSPTGLLHIGNLRTALISALIAMKEKGIFLLRIEDTDKARSELGFAEELQADLKWLGLEWQEGPGKDAGNGPYWQSQRQNIYDHYYQALEAKNLAYPCFCSEEQLALSRKIQRSSGKPPRYAGTCRYLSAEAVSEKIAQGLKPTLRFKVPNTVISFEDVVHGKQSFDGEDIGDFIIRRADGSASFMFCNAIDDALMGVTLASRGEDHLTNTPRQLFILNALELPMPQYAHISLIFGLDGAPLSKRNGSKSLKDLQAEGYLPLAIVNHLARLGHFYPETELLSLANLAAKFSTTALSKSPAKFDPEQLKYWQKQALQHTNNAELWPWLPEEVKLMVPTEQQLAFVTAIKPNILFPQDAIVWAHALFDKHLSLDNAQQMVLKAADLNFFTEALKAVSLYGCDYQAIIGHLKTTLNIQGKALFQPLRLALTGQGHGPDMALICQLLGITRLQARFNDVLQIL